ncbi:hypothetical protein PSTT_06039, partial [Puccinia striiformis]
RVFLALIGGAMGSVSLIMISTWRPESRLYLVATFIGHGAASGEIGLHDVSEAAERYPPRWEVVWNRLAENVGRPISGPPRCPGSQSPGGLYTPNDERLESLYSKISSIKNVTIDIHSDSLSQNRLLNQTGEQFDSFTSQLSDSASRFSRTIQAGSSQRKTIIYTVGGVVGLFFLYRIFG